MNIQRLTSGQQIKIKGAFWARAITIHTVLGSEIENIKKYNRNVGAKEAFDRATAEIEIRKARWAERGETYPMAPFAIQAPGVLTDNYPGKAEQLAQEELNFKLAPEIADGELVMIDGEVWEVKVLGLQYSDPIHFTRPAALLA